MDEYFQAVACGVEAWTEFWGDPFFSGTLMMVAYVLASFLTFRASSRLRGTERAAWLLASALMLFQVVNTPLDLHGLAWASARCLANIQGWYAERHSFQREVLIALATATVIVASITMIFLRRDFFRNALLILGLGLSLGMTITKGVNYHNLEALYGARFGPLATADFVELAGVAMILLASWLKVRKQSVEAARPTESRPHM